MIMTDFDPKSKVLAKGGYYCLTCNRCGNIWYSKCQDGKGNPKDPKNCTGCKSPYWNKKRKK